MSFFWTHAMLSPGPRNKTIRPRKVVIGLERQNSSFPSLCILFTVAMSMSDIVHYCDVYKANHDIYN